MHISIFVGWARPRFREAESLPLKWGHFSDEVTTAQRGCGMCPRSHSSTGSTQDVQHERGLRVQGFTMLRLAHHRYQQAI